MISVYISPYEVICKLSIITFDITFTKTKLHVLPFRLGRAELQLTVGASILIVDYDKDVILGQL